MKTAATIKRFALGTNGTVTKGNMTIDILFLHLRTHTGTAFCALFSSVSTTRRPKAIAVLGMRGSQRSCPMEKVRRLPWTTDPLLWH